MNPWISYVKEYASKKGISYRDALRDPKCKAGYKKGGCCGSGLVSDVKKVVKSASANASSIKKKIGLGIVDEAAAKGYADQSLIANVYNQSQLGANAHKKYVSL